MPLPKYVPGTGNLGAAQPLLDEMGSGYNKIADSHPLDAIMGMLGMKEPPAVAPPVQHGADPDAVRRANESFRTTMAQPPNPVVAPPRRKPMQ